jgi:L,D-transpeptidase YcbB
VRFSIPILIVVMMAAFGFYSHRESVPIASRGEHEPIAPRSEPAPIAPPAYDNAIARAAEALQVLHAAPAQGLDIKHYNQVALEAALEQLRKSDRHAADESQQVANLSAATNRALLTFAHDVAIGRVSPRAIDPNWKARRQVPDFRASLDQSANGRLNAWIEGLQPRHREYASLQRALQQLRDQEQDGGWPKVALRPLKPGVTDPAVANLRARLAASGELTRNAATNPATFDEDLEAAVKVFQEHHALQASGVADRATLVAMNVPLADRIRQVEINLERWRWMPDDFGDRHFLVNIPAYLLMARENGNTVRAIRVIVGKAGHETPVFSGEMETVVFSPYWNVPDSIAEDETGPAIRSDPNYLARNQIDVIRRTKKGATVVDPASVNWYDPVELNQLSFRQRPGVKNALGHVKFLFPNPFNVYLHDTPADGLFAPAARAFSHGCVRVEEPEALAEYVLRDRSEWTKERISSAMNAGVERYVKLDQTIPVHIVYFTAWVDEKDGLHFLPDVYGYDARQTKLTK